MPKKDPRNYNPQPAKRIADPRMPKKYLKLLQKQEKILAKNKKPTYTHIPNSYYIPKKFLLMWGVK